MRTAYLRLATVAALAALLGTVAAARFAASNQDATSESFTIQLIGGERELSLDGGAVFHRTANEILDTRLIDVSGSSVRLALWSEVEPEGRSLEYYAISLDGKKVARVRQASYVLKLLHGEFDPLVEIPAVESGLEADDESNLYIVQFVTQPLEVFREQVRALGGTLRVFLANHAHMVEMDAQTRAQVEALPFVRWVGPLHPAYKLEPFLRGENMERAAELFGEQQYNIMIFEHTPAAKNDMADRIAALGGRINLIDAGKHLVRATLTPEQLYEVVHWDEVMYVDRWGPYEADMDNGRIVSGANYLESVGDFTGQDVRGEIIDIGFNLGHVDFQSRPLIVHQSVGSASHGASTSGIIFGDGTGNPKGRGVLPDGQGIVISTAAMEGQSRYNDIRDLVKAPYFAVFQSSSVGSPRTTQYTTESANIDAALFDFDFILCQSQSNSGGTPSRPQAWGKNTVSVGGVTHHDNSDRDDDDKSGASTGPAADGRVKPTVAHFYDAIFTVTGGGANAYTSGFGGTSGATPIVAGHMGLIFQMWDEGVFGNEYDPEGTVFENRPHAATAKALLVNSAHRYPFSQGLRRRHQGWGLPDLKQLYDERELTYVNNEEFILVELEVMTFFIEVAADQPELNITMIYSDLPGVPNSNQHRINDLTLKVTAPNGTVYWGNNGLWNGNWSTPDGDPNVIDTVENVFIQNPEAGQWVAEVFADEVNEDGHVETEEIDADFALVVSGTIGVETVVPGLRLLLPDGTPRLVAPNTNTDISVRIVEGSEKLVEGSAKIHYRFNPDDPWSEEQMSPQGGEMFIATLPGAGCDDTPQYWFSARGDGGADVRNPRGAPDVFFASVVGIEWQPLADDFETDKGWTIVNRNVSEGGWVRVVPKNAGDGSPPEDFDGSGKCYVTGAAKGVDLDGGPTRLISKMLDLSNGEFTVSYAYWFTGSTDDTLKVHVSNNAGETWVLVISHERSTKWETNEFNPADFVELTDKFQVRFAARDLKADTRVEAGIDAFRILGFVCDDLTRGDTNCDGSIDLLDVEPFITALLDPDEYEKQYPDCDIRTADTNEDGSVDLTDVESFIKLLL